jgi:putative flippase GtrA
MEIIRFGIVGCLVVAIQYGVYYLLLPLLSHNESYSIGYLVSFCINYLLTTSFTFKRKKSFGNGIGFVFCHIFNYFLQIVLLNVFILVGCTKQLAPIPIFIICVPTNYMLVRYVIKHF